MYEMIKEAKESLKVLDKDFLKELEKLTTESKSRGSVNREAINDIGWYADGLKDIHKLLCQMCETYGYKDEEWTAIGVTDGMGNYAVKAKKDEYDDDEEEGPRVRR